jgi:hypothetical protein
MRQSAVFVCFLTLGLAWGAAEKVASKSAKEPTRLVSPPSLSEAITSIVSGSQGKSLDEVIDFANRHIKENGFVVEFDLLGQDYSIQDPPISWEWTVRLEKGRKEALRFPVDYGLCSEFFVMVPCIRVGKKSIDLVLNGKRHKVRRPKKFVLDTVALLDDDMQEKRRVWDIPFQAWGVLGVSANEEDIYLPVNLEMDDAVKDWWQSAVKGLNSSKHWKESMPLLILAVTKDQDYRFENFYDEIAAQEPEYLNLPKNPDNAYETNIRFNRSGEEHFIRFSSPCT